MYTTTHTFCDHGSINTSHNIGQTTKEINKRATRVYINLKNSYGFALNTLFKNKIISLIARFYKATLIGYKKTADTAIGLINNLLFDYVHTPVNITENYLNTIV